MGCFANELSFNLVRTSFMGLVFATGLNGRGERCFSSPSGIALTMALAMALKPDKSTPPKRSAESGIALGFEYIIYVMLNRDEWSDKPKPVFSLTQSQSWS